MAKFRNYIKKKTLTYSGYHSEPLIMCNRSHPHIPRDSSSLDRLACGPSGPIYPSPRVQGGSRPTSGGTHYKEKVRNQNAFTSTLVVKFQYHHGHG